jgi:hypothetical protein
VIIRVCLAAALLTPASVLAQGNPGPYGKLFGRSAASSAAQEHTTVEARASIGANYDDALLAPEGSPADTPLQHGVQAAGSAFLNLDHRSSIFIVNLNGGASRGESFTQPSSYGTNQYTATALVNAKLSTRFDARASASYIHSPSYQFFSGFGLGPVDPGNPADPANPLLPYSAYAAQMLENERVDATVSLTTHLTKQSSIELSATQHQTRFAEQPDDDVVVNGYRATWQWQLQRGLGVHAGFGQENVDLRAPERVDYQTALIDVGVDFNRAFSVARRTTLAFNTSTSLMKRDNLDDELRFVGGVTLAKFFRRTWHAGLQANRTASFVPGFAEPLSSDTVGAFLGGMFSTRLSFVASVSAARGHTIFSDISGFGTYTGTSQLSYALGKHVSVYGSYFTYWYEVPADVLTLSVPGTMARQVVSAGLRFYIPVYDKVRQGQ